jgi:hypothetical protein
MPVKPSEQEDEYFGKLEIQRRLLEQARKAGALAEEEKDRLKQLHHMRCPKCGMQLHEETLEGVAVDICAACHGVWLDDGELAKLTEGKQGIFASLREIFS